MVHRFERTTGLTWWLQLTLCAGGALACALCSVTPADAYCVYVPNVEAQSISVINTTTNSLSATIETDFNQAYAALTPDAHFLYIANRGDSDNPGNTVSVIDTTTNMVAAIVTLTAGSGPNGIAFTPNDAFAYVTGRYSGTTMVLDIAKVLTDPSNAIVTTIEVSCAGLGSAAISPNGEFAVEAGRNIAVR